ncbi:MAG: hypothetical protein AAF614_42405 [Chloroflexota bacterium]
MNETPTETNNHDEPTCYEIRIKGHLADRWAPWFEGLTIKLEESGHTLLTGSELDQAALHGVFKKVRNLGMRLLSVNCIHNKEI